MSRQNIKLNDFKLFVQTFKALSKQLDSVKINFNSEGFTIYGKNSVSRIETFSNSALAEKDPVEFCILDFQMFLKVLQTVQEIHKEDESEIKMWFDFPFIKIESDKFKTKLSTCKEEVIVNSISQKIKTQLVPVFEFLTSSKQIKSVNSHSFIMSDVESSRIYLLTDSEMENNAIYAKIGNETNELNNSMTLKLGIVTSGNIDGRKLIINFDRLNSLNIVDSEEIKVQLMDKNVLMNAINIRGCGDCYTIFKIYVSLLAN